MNVENIIKALEHQRNAALTQNVELMARNLELEDRLSWFEKNYKTEASEVTDESKKS